MSTTDLKNVAIANIRNRAGKGTRTLNPEHVAQLASSIAALGLLEPVVVDRDLRLLAGAHRLAASALVAEPDPTKRVAAFRKLVGNAKVRDFDGLVELIKGLDRSGWVARQAGNHVQVRIVNINSTTDADGALAVEAAENSVRRSFTVPEIEAIVIRLKKAGFRDSIGRPKAGQKSLRPALGAILGLSARQVRRVLKGGGRSGSTSQGWSGAVAALRRAVVQCQKVGGRQQSSQARRLLAALGKVEAVLGRAAA